MQHGYATPSTRSGNPCDIRPGDRVVTTQDERDGTRLRHSLDDDLKIGTGPGSITAVHLNVAAVDDAQIGEAVCA